MTRAFPHSADELFAGAAYYQSFEMVRFIVWRRGEGALGALAEQLARAEITAIDAFATAAGLQGNALEEAWSEYITGL